jgi:drug/metabolite transporter (DMT)-like permease
MVSLIWGFTFVTVKLAIEDVPALNFLSVRFWVASAAMLTLFWRRVWAALPGTLLPGFMIGVFLFGGFVLQTFGLGLTSASKAGFITGLSVVLVPLISGLILRQPLARMVAMGVLAATVGLALLALEGTLAPNRGDLLVLGGAFFFALHIIAVGRYAPGHDPMALATLQLVTVAVLSSLAAAAGEGWVPIPGETWPAILLTGLLASALAMAVQNWAQRATTATHTALIFATEPVFAALGGYLLAGEILGVRSWLGGTLIILGNLLAELPEFPRAARTGLRQVDADRRRQELAGKALRERHIEHLVHVVDEDHF